ncbi:hypothetical protein ACAG25_19885 [Mycobacterium sp. pV006]|uniref:hypothetical protein n=1 Tax=Mycobacterium sp. pV006 TaxID=3238983 RepID=UPI00351B239D
MTRTRRTAVLGAVTVVVALGIGGCASDDRTPPVTSPVETSPAPSVGLPPVPEGPPLPPPEALTDVLVRLSDPAVPGTDKVALISETGPADAAALDRFATALRDNRALPLRFEARDLAWSGAQPGQVVATVQVITANPGYGQFTYPLEFTADGPSWQLTRQSADLLLQLQPDPADPPR